MSRFEVRPRIRVTRDDGTIVLGPGKADLLEAIADHGSISAAAKAVGMSYMRAWTLVRTMNDAFASPLVEKIRGGSERGGARLTDRGMRLLEIYRAMEKNARNAIDAQWRLLRRELK
jgi:molybdate transport system regulatory protein